MSVGVKGVWRCVGITGRYDCAWITCVWMDCVRCVRVSNACYDTALPQMKGTQTKPNRISADSYDGQHILTNNIIYPRTQIHMSIVGRRMLICFFISFN